MFRSVEKLPEDQFVLNCILHFREGQNTMTLLKKHKKVRQINEKKYFLSPPVKFFGAITLFLLFVIGKAGNKQKSTDSMFPWKFIPFPLCKDCRTSSLILRLDLNTYSMTAEQKVSEVE